MPGLLFSSKRTPQLSITEIAKIDHYALFSAMFSLLLSIINEEHYENANGGIPCTVSKDK